MHGMFIATIKDWELIRVWRATSFKKRATEETEHELQASGTSMSPKPGT